MCDITDPSYREMFGPAAPAFDLAHPDWCPRDSGCVLPAGHDGDCDLTAALDPTPSGAGGVGSGEPKVDLEGMRDALRQIKWRAERRAIAARARGDAESERQALDDIAIIDRSDHV